MKKLLRKIKRIPKVRIIFWLMLLIMVIFLVYKDVVPKGEITYVKDFNNYSDFIEPLHPKERVLEPVGSVQRIIGDPIYFSMRTPRKLENVKLSLKYKSEAENLPIVSLGVLADKMLWRYIMEPVQNKIIDSLAKTWSVIENDGVIFLQKEKKYDSVDEFLKNLPSRNRIALYEYDLKNYYYLSGYQSGAGASINVPLRGEYQFYTYIKNEALNFNFNFIDLNENSDSDPIIIILYDQYNKVLLQKELEDDGISEITKEVSGNKQLNISSPSLAEGVYKVEVKVGTDIVTKSIVTNQSKISFKNRVWIHEGVNNVRLYSDSTGIDAITVNPGSLQSLLVNKDKMEILKTYQRFSLQNYDNTKTIIIPKGDIVITGNGNFSFHASGLFNPNFKKVDQNFSVGNTQYILANYTLPEYSEDGWQYRTVELDLSSAHREDNRNLFLIAIPGLKFDDGIKDSLIVSEIRAEFSGRTLMEFLKNKFNYEK